MRVLFLGKKLDRHCAEALDFTRQHFDTSWHLGEWGEALPDSARAWRGEYIVSYLSRWVVPAAMIANASRAAINFHPASPDYPGIGCNNFALYDGAAAYGATCHFMAPRVDTGAVIATRRFALLPSDDVASVLARTYDAQLELFLGIMARVHSGEPLKPNGETWGRAPYSRIEFNRLFDIRPDMDPDEVDRRVRATSFGQWQPFVEIAGYRFVLDPAAPRPSRAEGIAA